MSRSRNSLYFVAQGNYKIIPKSNLPLYTSGLATCSAISFTMNDVVSFMAHIDAKTNVDTIANKIISIYAQEKPIEFTNVKVWYGNGLGTTTTYHSKQLVDKFAILIGLNLVPPKEQPADIIVITENENNIIQCRQCMGKSGTLLIICHNYNCKYAHQIQIFTPGFMDTVYA